MGRLLTYLNPIRQQIDTYLEQASLARRASNTGNSLLKSTT